MDHVVEAFLAQTDATGALPMPLSFRLPALFAPLLFLVSGCADIGVPSQASYEGTLSGKIDEKEDFSAEIVLLLDFENESFTGYVHNFEFSRPRFDRPEGRVDFAGSISREEVNAPPVLQGEGGGKLVQGRYTYDIGEFQIDSYYVEGFKRITGGYFGGGGFTRTAEWEEWIGWLGMKGRFEAEVVCQTSLFNMDGCW